MNNEGYNNMSEKILKRLQSIINEDILLQEFSLISNPGPAVDRNVSPIKYLPNEHCLGLETWCVNHVFKYAQEQIFKLRKKKHFKGEVLNVYLTGALLIQPEVTTFWNIKRELLVSESIEQETELRFSKLVLSFKCKSYEAYNYRTFIINRSCTNTEAITRLVEDEYRVLLRTTSNTPNNYHAWNHRIWCFQNVVLKYLPKNIQLDELNFSRNWILSHVSEHSGFHYRQHLLNCFKNKILLPTNLLNTYANGGTSNFIETMIDLEYLEKLEEIDVRYYNQYLCLLIYELFNVLPMLHYNFPGHESIWYHRRFIMNHIYKVLIEIYNVEQINHELIYSNLPEDVNLVKSIVKLKPVLDKSYRLLAMESSGLYKNLTTKERAFLDELRTMNEWKGNDLDLQRGYEKWLTCILALKV